MRAMFIVSVLLVAACVLRDVSGSSITFPLRHRAGHSGQPTVVLYAGHPRHSVPLALVLSQPPPTFEPGVRVNAAENDLPGQYAALYIGRDDPLVHEDLVPGDIPRLSIFASGTRARLQVNSTLRAHPLTGHGERGALVLAPGSSAWLQWRAVTIRRNAATLSDDLPLPVPHRPLTALRCGAWDALGRCELADKQRIGGKLYAIVLDFDTPHGTLPEVLYGSLLGGETEALHWDAIDRSFATRGDVGDGTSVGVFDTTGATTPTFIVGDDAHTIVIGQRTLSLLFSRVTYDSYTATWLVVPALPYPEAARITVAILIFVQAFVIARFFVSALNLRLRAALEAAHTSNYPPALDGRQMIYMAVSAALSVTGAALGTAYTGHGAFVDTAVEASLVQASTAALVLTCAQTVLLFIVLPMLSGGDLIRVFWRMGNSMGIVPDAKASSSMEMSLVSGSGDSAGGDTKKSASTKVPLWSREIAPAIEIAAALLHVTMSAFGLAATIMPLACTYVIALLVFGLVAVLLLLAPLTYHTMSLFMTIAATPSRRPHGRASWIGLCVFLVLQVGVVVITCIGSDRWILRPLLEVTNDIYSPSNISLGVHLSVNLVLITVVYYTALEALAELQARAGQTQQKKIN